MIYLFRGLFQLNDQILFIFFQFLLMFDAPSDFRGQKGILLFEVEILIEEDLLHILVVRLND